MMLRGHIRASIYVLRTEEGGWAHPLFTNCKALFYFPVDLSSGWSGGVSIEGADTCDLGKECIAIITFGSIELVRDFLAHGVEFELRDGRRIIGRGKVIELLFE